MPSSQSRSNSSPKNVHRLLALALLAGLAPSALADDHAGAAPDALPLIPRATLFGNPERAGSQLSPDGKHISWLAPVNGVLNVFVAPVGDITQARAVTSDTSRGIRSYFWAYTSNHVLYIQDQGGDENWRVYAVDVNSNERVDLTPLDGVAAQIAGVSDEFPAEILVGLNDRNPQFHDVHRVNIVTGERTMLFQNDRFASVTTDEQFRVRFASAFNAQGGVDIFKRDDQGEFQPWESIPMTDTMTTNLMGFNEAGDTLYMMDSRGRDTGALFARDLATNANTLLASDPRADVGGILSSPIDGTVQAASFNYLKNEWTVLDESIKDDLDYLRTVSDGEVNVVSRTQDDTRWLVAFTRDNAPTSVYVYNRGENPEATYLYTNRPALENLPLTRMHAMEIPSRDGLNLVSYLSLPSNLDQNNDARPDNGPVPMVLLVHGGPWARDDWGYDPYHQWLTNRGYAVLSVNFRGSTGFGKQFVNAGNREWAGKMHDDLLDAVTWAVQNNVAQKDRVAIMGGSYGGYAALAGLTFTPDVFAAGVSIVGPSNLVTLLNSIPPYWAPAVQMFKDRVGDHTTAEGRTFLEQRSPLTLVDRIQRPLLIGQGANDPRVKQAESDQIVRAMQSHNIPVAYVLFPDEGHGFARPENNMAFNAVTEAFLAQHLGGRFEAVGADLEKSTARIQAGEDQIPGLSGAMAEHNRGTMDAPREAQPAGGR